MPQEHTIEAFEQVKRGPGRPRKELHAVEAPQAVAPVEEVKEPEAVSKPSDMVRIVIHPSQDGSDVNPLSLPPDPRWGNKRLILLRNKEIEVHRGALPLLDQMAKVVIEKQMELDEYGRPLKPGKKEVRVQRAPYTILG